MARCYLSQGTDKSPGRCPRGVDVARQQNQTEVPIAVPECLLLQAAEVADVLRHDRPSRVTSDPQQRRVGSPLEPQLKDRNGIKATIAQTSRDTRREHLIEQQPQPVRRSTPA